MERLLLESTDFEAFKSNKRDGYYYSHNGFEYSPPGWVKFKKRWYPMGYKAVRVDLSSLRLKKNPTPLVYSISRWTMLKKEELIPTGADEGGIWSGVSLSAIRKTEQSCVTRQKDPFQPKIYIAALYNPIWSNSYGVKSQGIMLLEELR